MSAAATIDVRPFSSTYAVNNVRDILLRNNWPMPDHTYLRLWIPDSMELTERNISHFVQWAFILADQYQENDYEQEFVPAMVRHAARLVVGHDNDDNPLLQPDVSDPFIQSQQTFFQQEIKEILDCLRDRYEEQHKDHVLLSAESTTGLHQLLTGQRNTGV